MLCTCHLGNDSDSVLLPCLTQPLQSFFSDTLERARIGPWLPKSGTIYTDAMTLELAGCLKHLLRSLGTARSGYNFKWALVKQRPLTQWQYIQFSDSHSLNQSDQTVMISFSFRVTSSSIFFEKASVSF